MSSSFRFPASLLNFLLVGLLLSIVFSCQSPGFDLIVQLRSSPEHPVVYRGSRVSVQFGKQAAEAPQPLTEDGRAAFPKLDTRLLNDTVRLTYLAKNGRPYRVVQQMFATAADAAGRPMEFVLEIVPDTTNVQFSVKDKNGPLVHALVKFDGGDMMVETNEYGLVNVNIAKPAGATSHVVIEKDGKVLLEKDLVLSPDFQRLYVGD